MSVLDRCVTLGREFGRREMAKHLHPLRAFYAAARDGKPSPNSWSEGFVDQWLAILRLPPFENALEVEPRGTMCSACNRDPGAIPSRRTVLTFPGGALMRCDGCCRKWLEPEHTLATT